MNKRQFLILALATASISWLSFPSANAAERKVFDMASFEAAQKSDARILVDISAPWCPTCKAQKPIIDKLAEQPSNNNLIIFSVDFDSQKPVVAKLGARSQSTLIAFRGKKETARSAGDTNVDSIASLVHSNTLK